MKYAPPLYGYKIRPGIASRSGPEINFVDPQPQHFMLADIIAGLARECRFGRQTQLFYSVAQHSVNVAHQVEQLGGTTQECFQALFHDAAEAYMGDCPSPMKQMLPEWKNIEHRLLTAIGKKFGFSPNLTDVVKKADMIMLVTEARRFLADETLITTEFGFPADLDTYTLTEDQWAYIPWPEQVAAAMFLAVYHELKNRLEKERMQCDLSFKEF